MSALDLLLEGLSLPQLSEKYSTAINAKISIKEIETAIFPPHKTPGPDGLSADFYKAHIDQLAPRLSLLLKHYLEKRYSARCLYDPFT